MSDEGGKNYPEANPGDRISYIQWDRLNVIQKRALEKLGIKKGTEYTALTLEELKAKGYQNDKKNLWVRVDGEAIPIPWSIIKEEK